MARANRPHEVANQFFQLLVQSQCNICWNLFSDKTQKEFIQWTLKDIYEQNPEAAKGANLGPPEIKLMLENNNMDLIIRFWRRFVRQSHAMEFHRYGYFETLQDNGRTATVEARLIYDNGKEHRVNLTMIKERGGWKLGYLESSLPF